jgi:chitodextrinase
LNNEVAKDKKVKLTWTASTDAGGGAISYKVYSNGILLTTTTSTEYEVSGLTSNTSYSFYVVAVGSDLTESDASTTLTVNVGDVEPPSVPQNLTVTGVTPTTISYSWSPSTDDISLKGYAIFVNRLVGGVPTPVFIGTTNKTTYTMTGLTLGRSYTVRIKAYDFNTNTGNQSDFSNAATATTADTSAPTQPSALTVTGTTSNSATVSWTASTDNVGVTGYAIYVNGRYLATTKNTSYTISGLSVATSYSVEVKAFDAAKNFSTGVTVSATTQNDTGAPTTPTNLTLITSTSSSVTVSWTASTDDVALQGYAIYRNGRYLATTKSTTYTLTGLTAGTNYSISVRAYDRAQNFSGFSSALSASTMP